MEFTENYPSEYKGNKLVKQGKLYYNSPNQHYGGKRHNWSTKHQTKAVGLTMGDKRYQMNRSQGVSTTPGHIRTKNRLLGPPGQKTEPKIDMKCQSDGSHPFNKGIMSALNPNVHKKNKNYKNAKSSVKKSSEKKSGKKSVKKKKK